MSRLCSTSHRPCRSFAVLGAALLLLAGVVAGCDWLVGGEGELEVTVSGPGQPFGGVVLLVSGEDLLGVRGAAGTEVWRSGGEDELAPEIMVAAVQREESGPVRILLRVRDRSAPAPSVAIVSLADLDDETVAITSEHRVRVSR